MEVLRANDGRWKMAGGKVGQMFEFVMMVVEVKPATKSSKETEQSLCCLAGHIEAVTVIDGCAWQPVLARNGCTYLSKYVPALTLRTHLDSARGPANHTRLA